MAVRWGSSAGEVGDHSCLAMLTSEQSEWKGVVKMAESLGSDTFLHIQDSGVAETLTVRADGEKSFNRGQEVFLQPKKESLHLFNQEGDRQ